MHSMKTLVTALWAVTLFTTSAFSNSVDDEPIASLGDVSISFADVDAEASLIKPEDRYGFFVDAERTGSMLENMLLRRSVVENQSKIAAELELDLKLIREKVGEKNLIEAQLEIMADAALKEFTDENIEQHALEIYNSNPDQYYVDELINISHLLISPRKRPEEEAVALINELSERAEQGEDFETLIMSYSDDPTKDRNKGQFKRVSRGKMVPEFETVAFALSEIGQLSKPVRTEFGWHLIKLLKKQPSQQKSFEQAKPALISRIRQNLPEESRKKIASQFNDPKSELLALALENDLDKTIQHQNRVNIEIEKILLEKFRFQYKEQHAPDNLEAYAKELYVSNKKKYIEPLTVEIQRIISAGVSEQSRKNLETFVNNYDENKDIYSQLASVLRTNKLILIEGTHIGGLAKASFDLQNQGEMTAMVKGTNSWEVAILLNKKPAYQPTLADKLPGLIAQIKQKKSQEAWDAYLFQFKQKKLWANPDAVASIRQRYAQQ